MGRWGAAPSGRAGARGGVEWLVGLLALCSGVASCGPSAPRGGVLLPAPPAASADAATAGTRTRPLSPFRPVLGARAATAVDVTAAAVATVVEPMVVALPALATGLHASVVATAVFVDKVPELVLQAFCEQATGPPLALPAARLERSAAADDDDQPTGWLLVAEGPLLPVPAGPLARPPAAQEHKPVRLELRSSGPGSSVEVALWTGGWLLCALPTMRVLVDGRGLDELEGWPAGLDAALTVDSTGLRTRIELPVSVVRLLMSARQIEVHWNKTRAVLEPAASPAVTELRELLGAAQRPDEPEPQ